VWRSDTAVRCTGFDPGLLARRDESPAGRPRTEPDMDVLSVEQPVPAAAIGPRIVGELSRADGAGISLENRSV
jgi:hypothetical protein